MMSHILRWSSLARVLWPRLLSEVLSFLGVCGTVFACIKASGQKFFRLLSLSW